MNNRYFLFFTVVMLVLLTGCQSAANTQYSLDTFGTKKTDTQIITGVINYTSGYFFPTGDDVMDISLVGLNLKNYEEVELSHQRIRSIQKFPLQFTIRYDNNEVSDGMQYFVEAAFKDSHGTTLSGKMPVRLYSGEKSVNITIR